MGVLVGDRKATKKGTKAAKKGGKAAKSSKKAIVLPPVATVKLQFTKNGVPVGPPRVAPPPANDLRLIWQNPPGRIVQAFWTRNGQPIAPIPVPPGANDAHLKIG